MKKVIETALLLLASIGICLAAGEMETNDQKQQTIEDVYPGLASGALAKAKLDKLPEGVILRSNPVEIDAEKMKSILPKGREFSKEEIAKNHFFFLEQHVTRQLLMELARKKLPEGEFKEDPKNELAPIRAYFSFITSDVKTTEEEVREFYDNNTEMFGGAKFDQMKDQLTQFVLNQKKGEVINQHIKSLAEIVPVTLSAEWVKKQAPLAFDNPVDKARKSGLPTLVDFGADGCTPCDMMAPILEELKKEYERKLNVVFVHVRKQQILSARYGVGSIPYQAFYDKEGKQFFTHTGFFSKDEILKKLSEIGVK